MYSKPIDHPTVVLQEYSELKELILKHTVSKELILDISKETSIPATLSKIDFFSKAEQYYKILVDMHSKYTTIEQRYKQYGMKEPIVDIYEQPCKESCFIHQRYDEAYGYTAEYNNVFYVDILKHFSIRKNISEYTRVYFLYMLCSYNYNLHTHLNNESKTHKENINVEYISSIDDSIVSPDISDTIKVPIEQLTDEAISRLGKVGISVLIVSDERIRPILIGSIEGNKWVLSRDHLNKFSHLLGITYYLEVLHSTTIAVDDKYITLYIEGVKPTTLRNNKIKFYNNTVAYKDDGIQNLHIPLVKYKEDLTNGFMIKTNNPKAKYYLSLYTYIIEPYIMVDSSLKSGEEYLIIKDSNIGLYLEIPNTSFIKYGIFTNKEDALKYDKHYVEYMKHTNVKLKQEIKREDLTYKLIEKKVNLEVLKEKIDLEMDKIILTAELDREEKLTRHIYTLAEYGSKLKALKESNKVTELKADIERMKNISSIGKVITNIISSIF